MGIKFPEPLVGVTVNKEPLQLPEVIFAAINGLGFTVIVYSCSAPAQMAAPDNVAVALKVTTMSELVLFIKD